MLAGKETLAVLAVSLRGTVMQIISPSDICQVYSYDSSLLQPFHNVAMQQLTTSTQQMLSSSSISELPC